MARRDIGTDDPRVRVPGKARDLERSDVPTIQMRQSGA